MQDRIVLASASPRREQLLRQIGILAEVYPSGASEESYLPPEKMVLSLARRKAEDVAEKVGQDAFVIGADTVVVLDDAVLGKPKDAEHAADMLRQLGGRVHAVYTGVCVMHRGIAYCGAEHTRVWMEKLSDVMIEEYIATGEPRDKAGAYGIQGIGAKLIRRIEGCFYNVVGLPLHSLCGLLRQAGMDI
jgi:septum formation protein